MTNHGRWTRLPWVTAAVVAVALLAGLVPGGASVLEYDRQRAGNGEPWLPLTGQLVHWTWRMALADLGTVALLGAWLETRRSRRGLVLVLIASAVAVGGGLYVAGPRVAVYRGASGPATALFVAAAVALARDRGWPGARVLACAALAVVASKIAAEWILGRALVAGPLPDGIAVLPLAHLLGALAGAAVAIAEWGFGRSLRVPGIIRGSESRFGPGTLHVRPGAQPTCRRERADHGARFLDPEGSRPDRTLQDPAQAG